MPLSIDLNSGTRNGESVAFQSNGYYWFLHPFFEEVKELTGQMIDLYADARFEGAALAALAAVLDKARRAADSKPSTWEECIGWEDESRRCPILDPVRKAALIEIIERKRLPRTADPDVALQEHALDK